MIRLEKMRIQMFTQCTLLAFCISINAAFMIVKSLSKCRNRTSCKNLWSYFTFYNINNPLRVTIKSKINKICLLSETKFICRISSNVIGVSKVIDSLWPVLHTSDDMRKIFEEKPILSFKQPRNLKDVLVKSKLRVNKESVVGIKQCGKSRCQICRYVNEGKCKINNAKCEQKCKMVDDLLSITFTAIMWNCIHKSH